MRTISRISLLVNSFHYYLTHVYIEDKEGGYRLVVLRHNRVLTDRHYKTLEGAKIAFARMYGCHAWAERVKPDWSFFYSPDADWLDHKNELIKREPLRLIH